MVAMVRFVTLLVAMLIHGAACAQAFPAKPVRMQVGFSAGGAPDIIARMLGAKLQESLGQPIVIENRPGASGNIAADAVVKSPADGYNLLLGNVSLTISAHATPKPPYDLLQDLDPVGMVVSLPLMLVVNAALPVSSLRELIDYARARQGQLNYGSVGIGSAHHLSGEMLSNQAGARMVHVPYKGGGAAIQAVLAQESHLLFLTPLALMPHVKSGKLKALGVTSSKRTASAPDVPTIAEAGLAGFNVDNWHTLFAPRGTPREVVARLNAELNRVLSAPEVKQQLLASQGAEAWISTPDEARGHVRAELEKWGKVIQASGVKLQQ
jgi:tripartite-type tricarboxylate transporter receptor subunit TctC